MFRFSDRYKVFVDLYNLSNFLIPRDHIPPLSSRMKLTLRSSLVEGRYYSDSDSAHCSSESEDDIRSPLPDAMLDLTIAEHSLRTAFGESSVSDCED